MTTSVAEYYHEQTKYTAEGIARGGRGLDFNKQPVPFKDYATATGYDLTRHLPEGGELRSDAELAAWRAGLPEDERSLAELSHLLYFTNGITAVIPYAGQPFLMRAAPSAGGLYPTEIYVAAQGHPILPDGLYNYQVRDHSLAHFWAGDARSRLAEAAFGHPDVARADLVVVCTGVFERSAWRYEDRAYRRILLDTGHVLGNLALYAPRVGRRVVPVGGFADAAVDDLLFLDGEEEGAIAMVALLPAAAPPSDPAGPTALPGPRHPRRELAAGQRLLALHEATRIPPGEAPPPVPPAEARPVEPTHRFHVGEAIQAGPLVWEGTLGPTIMKRRSTRTYSGEGLSREDLAQLLDFTYRPDLAPAEDVGPPALFAPHLLETFVVVHDVEGLDPGCYHYDPATRVLRQTRFTTLRDQVRYLALGQDLAGSAGAVVIHTADLPRAVAQYGDRAYRYLHLDAGHLGERLNVAAIRLGLGVSGIGGFFDDEVNDMLGIPEREAVLYLTTLGKPSTER
jgi:SagB-type dehydrogenase family enzyme